MSDRARALVWSYYDQKRYGVPLILPIALSDEADDRGGGIFQSNFELAKKTQQTERTVRKQLRKLEGMRLVECVERSVGGPGQFSQYRLNLALLIDDNNPERGTGLAPSNPERGTGLTRNVGPGYAPPNPERGTGLADPTIYKESKDLLGADVVAFRVDDEVEDQRLAAWIFERIQVLNPKHREPSWPAWRKDLRLMRTRDKRSRREIALLFSWANADPFWQANVLSPGTLRKQWERLEMKRLSNGGGTQAPTSAGDRICAHVTAGVRCTRPGQFTLPDGKSYCWDCKEAEERERASSQA